MEIKSGNEFEYKGSLYAVDSVTVRVDSELGATVWVGVYIYRTGEVKTYPLERIEYIFRCGAKQVFPHQAV